MSSNKSRRSFLTSLKFRLALSYAVIFICFGSLLFSFILWQLGKILFRSNDETVDLVMRRISSIFIAGDRTAPYQERISPDQLPVVDREIIEDAMPDATILYVCRQPRMEPERKDEFFHTVYLHRDDGYFVCRVRDDGTIFSEKVVLKKNLAALKRYFSRLIDSYGKENIFCTIRNVDNSTLIASHSDAKLLSDRLHPDVAISGKPVNSGNCRYRTTELPCGRIITVGWNIKPYRDVLKSLTLRFNIILLTVLAIGCFTAYWLSRRFIQGIKKTTMAMSKISDGDYSYRIGDMAESDREIQELMETFNAMNERTETLLKDMKMMSDNVAHDLRTPLTRISGTVELLLCDRNLDEQVRSVCVSVAEETAKLRDMVNTMMDISHTTYRPGELNKAPLDLTEMVSDLCDFMLPAFEERQIELRLCLPSDSMLINADKVKLQRLLVNLLENALKFTSRGFVAVTLECQQNNAVLEIKDSGCGISADDLKHIFERFYRADGSRHLQGNGLGLALVDAIVKAHNWQIAVSSTPGEGTAFKLTMPLCS